MRFHPTIVTQGVNGSTILEAINDSIKLAKENKRPVVLVYNEIAIFIKAESSPFILLEIYNNSIKMIASKRKERFVFQLKATGQLRDSGNEVVKYSSTVFNTQKAAKKRTNRFREAVCDIKKLDCIDPNNVKIEIEQLEIIEDSPR